MKSWLALLASVARKRPLAAAALLVVALAILSLAPSDGLLPRLFELWLNNPVPPPGNFQLFPPFSPSFRGPL